MQRILLIVGLAFGVALAAARFGPAQTGPKQQAKPAAEQKRSEKAAPEQKPATPPADRSADEAAIRANVEAFVKAYNAGEAKAIAALFAPDGQVVDDEGTVSEGREAVEQAFVEVFTETPQARIEVFVTTIQYIGSDLAVEVGSTKVTPAPGSEPRPASTRSRITSSTGRLSSFARWSSSGAESAWQLIAKRARMSARSSHHQSVLR